MENGGYGVMSLDPMEEDRSYDEVASAIAAREWNWQEVNDMRSDHEAMDVRFVKPTQFDDAYEKEIDRERHIFSPPQ